MHETDLQAESRLIFVQLDLSDPPHALLCVAEDYDHRTTRIRDSGSSLMNHLIDTSKDVLSPHCPKTALPPAMHEGEGAFWLPTFMAVGSCGGLHNTVGYSSQHQSGPVTQRHRA